MARDYKNITEAKVSAKRARAIETSRKSPEEKAGLPGWVWLTSGVVIGGFISFIVYLKLNVSSDIDFIENNVKSIASPDGENSAGDNKPSEQETERKNTFKFYEFLTNQKDTEISREEKSSDSSSDTRVNESASGEKSKEVVNSRADSIQKKEPLGSYIYTLQVGSFLNFKDADKHKANLALLGIGSKIHSIRTSNKIHYRVLVGPYNDLKQINEIDSLMKSNNIQTLLLKERV